MHPAAHASISVTAARRRGVLLLVVLSMLTLFMLLGTTYVILASRARTTARAFLKLADDQARTSTSIRPLLRDAALQVIRGSANASSAIRFHDLLNDKYNGSIEYRTAGEAFAANSQLLRLELRDKGTGAPAGGQYCGLVLTFTEAPEGVKNTSQRIIESDPGSNVVYVIRPPRLANPADINAVLVNNRDFSGVGFPTNDAFLPNWSLVAPSPTGSPNEDYDAFDEQNIALGSSDGSRKSFHAGEAIEYWVREYGRSLEADAGLSSADLARDKVLRRLGGLLATYANSTASHVSVPQWDRDVLERIRRASLRPFAFDHCPTPGTSTIDFTGRPLTTNGLPPQADGSNFRYDALLGLDGDVDNDGDGVLESFWLDVGHGTFLMPDRKRVKPLVAIHCIDLGGRLNLNVHGSPAHVLPTTGLPDQSLALANGDQLPLPGSRELASTLRAGAGFGPADVRLDAVLGSDGMKAVMLGGPSVTGIGDGIRRDVGAVVGRYGDKVGSVDDMPRPGRPGVADQRPGSDPALWADRAVPGNYQSPPDLWGRMFVAMDHRGNPFYINRDPNNRLDAANETPYAIDVTAPRDANPVAQAANSPSAWIDQPFTIGEMESLLRTYDSDTAATLPPRAMAMLLSGGDSNRRLLTTESWDTPAVIGGIPAFGSDPDLQRGLKMELNRSFGNGKDDNDNGVVDEAIEIGDGLDNNGNGAIDEPAENPDPFGTAFDANDLTKGWWLTRGATPFAIKTQPGPEAPWLRARQTLAHHLFALFEGIRTAFAPPAGNDPGLLLFAMKDVNQPVVQVSATAALKAVDRYLFDPDRSVEELRERQKDHAQRALAQWAVNIVDFLDADAIMTPYRYSGGYGEMNVVWGCEFPDLLLTETLAFHDRAIADTLTDNNPQGSKLVNDGSIDDEFTFDQIRVPQGSLFVELHAIRSQGGTTYPPELYSQDPVTKQWLLDLGRVPNNQPNAAPVWRLSLTGVRKDSNSPTDDVFKNLMDYPDTEHLSPTSGYGDVIGTTVPCLPSLSPIKLERYVWFTPGSPVNNRLVQPSTLPAIPAPGEPDTAAYPENAPNKFNTFTQAADSPAARLLPGDFLVVGPRKETCLGSKKKDTNGTYGVPAEQRIRLAAADGQSAAVAVYGDDGTLNPQIDRPANTIGDALPPPAANPGYRRETKACWVQGTRPANWTRNGFNPGLSVSEPLGHDYYAEPAAEFLPDGFGRIAYGSLAGDAAKPFRDIPEDNLDNSPLSRTKGNRLSQGTHLNVSTVFLERLADPTRPHDPRPELTEIVDGNPTPRTNPNWNPYIVIDFMPIDLTVFNGETDQKQIPRTPTGDELATVEDPATREQIKRDVADNSLENKDVMFFTRQRGFDADFSGFDLKNTLFPHEDPNQRTSAATSPNPWRPVAPWKRSNNPTAPDPVPPVLAIGGIGAVNLEVGSSNANFRCELGRYKPDADPLGAENNNVPTHTLGWVNQSYGRRLGSEVPEQYQGAPSTPLPWITWNDRPFTSEYELLLVPRTSPSRLLTNYRNLNSPTEPEGALRINDTFGAMTAGWHLMPLTSITDTAVGNPSRSRNADVLSRIFSYVHVRSRFAGTYTALDSTWSLSGPGDPTRVLKPPFNVLPHYREPGAVNLNTIPDSGGDRVWNALCGNGPPLPAPEPAWSSVVGAKSRIIDSDLDPQSRGSVTPPFRALTQPFAGAAAIPYVAINNAAIIDTSNPPRDPPKWFAPKPVSENDRPWWKPSDPNAPDPLANAFSPRSYTLFGDSPGTSTPLFAMPPTTHPCSDPARSAWFRFAPLIRAASNTTVRSEVYAVWITLGLFEVEAAAGPMPVDTQPGDPLNPVVNRYPDGWRLVREYGSQSGEINRYRAFFIFDRSIPVGCQPGSDLNVDDAILVERYLE